MSVVSPFFNTGVTLHHVSGRSGKFAALKNCLNFGLVWRNEIEPSFLLLLLGAIQNIAFI